MQNWLKLLVMGLAVLVVIILFLWAAGAFGSDARLRTWTAPGADSLGSGGSDTLLPVLKYDLRYLNRPITAQNWDSAIIYPINLVPKMPGMPESLFISDLPNGRWYFALRSVDSAGNWSGLSNIAVAKVDRIPPAVITDLK